MRAPERAGPAVVADYADQIFATRCDVTDRDSVRAAVAAGTERFGGVDALVNNAAVLLFGAIEDLREDEIQLAMDTNVVAHIRAAQAVLLDEGLELARLDDDHFQTPAGDFGRRVSQFAG